ncbi:MAG: PQQ-binding-like beta-propeller repeat protein [Verrucomicrobiota bacterium]
MDSPPFDDLAFLGLSQDVTLEKLKATRNALVKEFHPDRFQTEEELAEAHEQTVRINAACERVRAWLEAETQKKAASQRAAEAEEQRRAATESTRQARARAERKAAEQWETAGKRPGKAEPNAVPPRPDTPKPPATANIPRQFAWTAVLFLLGGLLIYLGIERFKGVAPTKSTGTQPPVAARAPQTNAPVRGASSNAIVSRPAVPRTNAVASVPARAGNILWEQTVGDVLEGTLHVTDGTIYLASKDGVAHALMPTTGGARWRVRLGAAPLFLRLDQDPPR